MRNPPNSVPFDKVHRAEFGAANSRRVLQHALEHGIQVAGRAADNLKDFGRSGLPLQRFGQLAPESGVFLF